MYGLKIHTMRIAIKPSYSRSRVYRPIGTREFGQSYNIKLIDSGNPPGAHHIHALV